MRFVNRAANGTAHRGTRSLPANREVAAETRQRNLDGTDKRDRVCGVLFSTSNYTL